MQLLEGRCPQCGTNFNGWVVESYSGQVCLHCGAALVTISNSESPLKRGTRKPEFSSEHAFSGYMPVSDKKHPALHS